MLLEMKKITKNFGAVCAVDAVDFSVRKGEIHGLLGENGAGKTTLMNVLAGVHPKDGGEIVFNGEKLESINAAGARKLGIRFIHQELNLFNHLTIYENLFFGEEITRKNGMLDRAEMIRQSKQILESLHLDFDPRLPVEKLDPSGKQLIEIAKAIRGDCRLVIMDEPTSTLTNKEIDRLFEIMRTMKARGVSLIYISHKMPELFAVCDRYTVMRDGKLVGAGNFADITEKEITQMLVGRAITEDDVQIRDIRSDAILKVEGASIEGFFQDVSFELRRGEVLALTGLTGDGRSELAEALFGMRRLDRGSVYLNGKPLNMKSIQSVIRSGIGMVQRNRKERSILPDMSIVENLSIANFVAKHRKLFISPGEELKRFMRNREVTNIKADSPEKNLITSLSGGNQQKVILSRWLEIDSDVYILDNPTQGIDVGAKSEIYRLIKRMAIEDNKSILVLSSEFREINQVADRALVFYKGRLNTEMPRTDFDEETIMYYATGSNLVTEGKDNA